MKKVITGSLLTIMISNNLVYAEELKGEILDRNENVNISTTTEFQNQEYVNTTKEETENLVNSEKNVKTLEKNKSLSTNVLTVSNFVDFKKVLETYNVSNKTINITNDIMFTGNLTISSKNKNVIINGNNKKIDLNNKYKFIVKANNTKLNNIEFTNYKSSGLTVYGGYDITLSNLILSGKDINVENTQRSTVGIDIYKSTVKLDNIFSKNHLYRGIQVRGGSAVDILSKNTHTDDKVHIQLIKDSVSSDNIMNDINGFYLEGEQREDNGKTTIDYFSKVEDIGSIKQKESNINAKTNTEVKNPDGSYIRLAGDGITDDTENLEKLIEYAAINGKEIYFPAGVYKISRDVDLSKMNLPELSNFTLSGDKNSLTIFDASLNSEKMIKLKSEEYKPVMNNVNVNNIVFNNMGLAFNGSNKKGISLNNNVFINGKYTREKDSLGNIIKATMIPYIEVKNSTYLIEKNIFLRGNNYPGRGVSTYRSKNTIIKDNFFGRLEGINDASRMLPPEVINKLNLINNGSKKTLGDNLKVTKSQGNFLTAVNNERYDENVSITNNYFNMDKTRNINSDFGTDVLIFGINVAKHGQRRDHIIYSKGYNGLNIYGNYFEGMENGVAGGVKIRNGKNAYVGSNHFKDVPILTYIYGDLTRKECVLYNTTIYNNLLHQTANFGGRGTGILYYQSYIDGDNLSFKVNNTDGTTSTNIWGNAYGDVQNFLVYKNKFMSKGSAQITISSRAQTAYKNNQFISNGNKYVDKDILVNYNSGNLKLPESPESDILTKLNDGYKQYKDVSIPLTSEDVDYKYINKEIDKANKFYGEVEKNNLIGVLGGQYSKDTAKELKALLLETTELIKSKSLNQRDTNKRVALIQETLEKLKASVKKYAPKIKGIDNIRVKIGEKFDPLNKVTAIDEEDGDLTNKIRVSGKVDTSKAGDYKITYQVTDSDKNTVKYNRIVMVEDNNAPKIKGIDNIRVKIGEKFDPLNKVTAIDEEDGDLTNKIRVSGKVDTSKAGDYKITYQVTDSDKNTVKYNRIVMVEDNNAPKIKGIDNIRVKIGEKFDPLNKVTAIDEEDGDLTNKIRVSGKVDTSKAGDYKITYQVTDSDKNTVKYNRIVMVEDNNAPKIKGIDNIRVKIGEKFDPLNKVTAIDEEDGDLTNKIRVSGKVDTSKAGDYKITYQVTDSDKNTVKYNRSIIKENNNISNYDKDNLNNELNNSKNPKTGDNIFNYILVVIMSLLVIPLVNRKKKYIK
ncbi:DUF5011 domain-containing protein [Paraclostridium sordellii]|uniref:immunoglobulin-like domain-containing protein n=1 Tax=Paraclostridium sordellii TaxID=1505 RepID=UPI0030D0C2D5